MIPDAEKIVGAYLRAHPEIVALGASVVPDTPEDRSDPWVRLAQLDVADQSDRLEYLVSFMLQLDCYAGDANRQGEASTLVRTVRAALHTMPQATLADVVVTGVRFGSSPRLPDAAFEPARERYALTAFVSMHAA